MGNKSILVVGGGISGLTAAVEAAEVGYEVYIVEKNPYLGGRVAQLNQYFPKLCPPNCGLEINFRRIKNNPKIHFFTQAEVTGVSGQEGDLEVRVKINPRYVNENCTACGKCVEVCPAERENDFNYGLDKTKAIYLPHIFAFPLKYVIDSRACRGKECGKCLEACAYGAIDLDMQPKEMALKVGSIVWATGWNPYDASKISYYGFGRYKNVITNVMMERLASINGPTGGRIVRPSDGKPVEKVAFVQCAGSRDENHLPYCSGICCLASLKQATYVLEQNPAAQAYIFFIDIRALGKYEDFYARVKDNPNLHLIKGKAGEITEDPETKDLIVVAEDQVTQKLMKERFDMVVLATGMVPATREARPPVEMAFDGNGFVVGGANGVYGAGCVHRPMDVASCVQDATAAALKAIQSTLGR
ncbi:CoB--CoM heterodisulfide reductase iron-sulfur subunit A family protein [Desulfovirgula thermocuniculi]|uniref:CoB--CoM heterodisulfide reductase iron-sulfur subunit A family protein n=1 Tax=Desulfovirgula thermocuniculi TaxID=348842 RepID=UPI000426B4BB|nr:CoB--CoM heterodisulfide reductase iron-sulfur subunit A family protein [Desulfovirgula thermocuniculi]